MEYIEFFFHEAVLHSGLKQQGQSACPHGTCALQWETGKHSSKQMIQFHSRAEMKSNVVLEDNVVPWQLF